MIALTDSAAPDCRAALRALHRAPEQACVDGLAALVAAARLDSAAIGARAGALIVAVREARKGASGVDNLMHEFSLSSQEGIALMCLSEALLRIPDAATRDLLIRDKVGKGDWRAHLGQSGSIFVNAATWGLMITHRLVGTHSEAGLASTLTRLIGRGGEPMIRRGVEFAMTLLGQQFVTGETIDDALARSRDNIAKGYTHSYDMLGEAALTADDAARYFAAYAEAIDAIGRSSRAGVVAGPGISVKLSALHPRYSRAQRQRVLDELYPRLLALAVKAAGYDMSFNIDAEEADRLELSLDLIERLAADPALGGWAGLGVVVQAYQKRCPAVIDHLVALARAQGRRLMVRLVKGAYWDSEIKRAQVDGLTDYPVFTRKPHTDLSYIACAARLLDAADVIYAQFATHNAHTLATVEHLAELRGVSDFEFQCLHGMGEALYDNLVGAGGRRCRIYAPVGRHETLLPYLVRRLLENGANSSFVNRIVDESVSIGELVTDPLEQARASGGRAHAAIALPRALYGAERTNALGADLSDEPTLAALARVHADLNTRLCLAAPLIAATTGGGDECQGREVDAGGTAACIDIANPADRRQRVGAVREATIAEVHAALAAASACAPGWHAREPHERAAILRAAADALEQRGHEFMSLCVREAGKTWPAAVAEVREAIDFLRYYAARAVELPVPARPPGSVVCISPWNFPLAIFLGEVSAALAAGSPVLAKPAEQTPLIAHAAVELLHAAGVPVAVLQLLPGRGETVGAALTGDVRVRGVVFTGSTEVAQHIAGTLAAREAAMPEVRLIAETGGMNAMIVDSSAHTEQVVADVMASGFDSAGQRCSALRLLYLQGDIADRVIAMLKAAMGELRIGNPADLATDVGPVIDEEARERLNAHVSAMRARGHPVHQCPLPPECAQGSFVAPTLIEITSPAELENEVFGPIVHVLRFSAGELDTVIDAVNGTGFGLTFGMHSRIDESIAHVTTRIRAGNLYVNRNMVGAVVGVQPFGGQGKSGTGPKAGGPCYLPRLLDLPVVPAARLGLRRPAGAVLPEAFQALVRWAHDRGDRALSLACAEYAAATPLGTHTELAGPTGEENTLRFAARGRVGCCARDEASLLAQIAAVMATANVAVIEHADGLRAAAAAWPAAVGAQLEWAPAGDSVAGIEGISAVLSAMPAGEVQETRRQLARRPGELVPVIVPHPESGLYPLLRLMHEQVLSVNVTAAGGNASLMTLAP